jgi:hypothetical protein
MKRKVTILLILALFLSGCSSWKEEPFPQDLIGRWETDEPRYDGCSFEITKNQIIFSNIHENYIDINTIKGIEKTVEDDKILYHIDYENNEGLEYKFSLVYMNKGGRDVIHYKNQKEVKWVKKDELIEF